MENSPLFEKSKLKIINLGLEVLNESVKMQGCESIHVDWRPPAGGDLRLIEIIERLNEM